MHKGSRFWKGHAVKMSGKSIESKDSINKSINISKKAELAAYVVQTDTADERSMHLALREKEERARCALYGFRMVPLECTAVLRDRRTV